MEEENLEKQDSDRDKMSNDYKCPECKRTKFPYIQIIDIDSFVDKLEDWD